MVSPPSLAGSVKAMLTEAFPAVAESILGASGAVAAGVNKTGDDAKLLPTEFTA